MMDDLLFAFPLFFLLLVRGVLSVEFLFSSLSGVGGWEIKRQICS